MPENIGHSYGTGALSSTPAVITVGAHNDAPKARAVPGRSFLESVAVRLTDCVSAPTSCTMHLRRSSGAKITPSNTDGATVDLDFDAGSTTEADAIWDMDGLGLVLEADESLEVVLALDTGTASGVVRVSWWRH